MTFDHHEEEILRTCTVFLLAAGATSCGPAGLSSIIGQANESEPKPPPIHVLSVTPPDGAIDQAVLGFEVRVQFEEELDAGSVDASSVRLLDFQGMPVAVLTEVEGDTLTVSPSTRLGLDRPYELVLDGDDLEGKEGGSLGEDFRAAFRTRSGVWGQPVPLGLASEDLLVGLFTETDSEDWARAFLIREASGVTSINSAAFDANGNFQVEALLEQTLDSVDGLYQRGGSGGSRIASASLDDPSDYLIFYREGPATGWIPASATTGQLLGVGSCWPYTPSISASPSLGAASWIVNCSGQLIILGAIRTGGGWSLLSSAASSTLTGTTYHDVCVVDTDRVLFAWLTAGSSSVLETRLYSLQQGWQSSDTLYSTTISASALRVVNTGTGLMFIWREGAQSVSRLKALFTTYDLDPIGTPVQVDAGCGNCGGFFRVETSDFGACITWIAITSTQPIRYRGFGRIYDLGEDAWSDVIDLFGEEASDLYFPHVSFQHSGQVDIVWTSESENDGSRQVATRRWLPGEGWRPGLGQQPDVVTPGTLAEPQIATRPDGRALVVHRVGGTFNAIYRE